METVLYAPFPARVKELVVITGSQVETGTPLVKLEPIGDGAEEDAAATAEGPSLDLPAPPRAVSRLPSGPPVPARPSRPWCSGTTCRRRTRTPR